MSDLGNGLTIVSIPKAFRGHFGVIQINAIRSWTLLEPRPEIILFGDDPGTAEIATELGLRHEPELQRNESDTPLVSHVFEKAQRLATHNILCYANADIILTNDFNQALARVISLVSDQKFLMVGRKTSLEITELLDFEESEWEVRLRRRAATEGKYITPDSDYFVFPRGFYSWVPRFAIGRCYWSAWLMYDARRRGAMMIDATSAVLAIESKHDYSHAKSTGGAKRLSGVEYRQNHRLFRGCRYFTTYDATHELDASGLLPATFRRQMRSWQERLGYCVYFLMKGDLYPYTLPLIGMYRAIKRTGGILQSGSRILVGQARTAHAMGAHKRGPDGV